LTVKIKLLIPILIILLLVSFVNADLNTSLNSYYGFNENLLDELERNDATTSGATSNTVDFISGNGSYYMDGVNFDSITIGTNTYNTDTDFSLNIWTYIESFGDYEAFFSSFSNNHNFCYFEQVNSGKLQLGCHIGNVGQFQLRTDNIVLNTEEWTQISFSREGSVHKIYVNGSEVPTTYTQSVDKTKWFDDLPTPTVYYLGHSYPSNFPLDASLDEVGVYNRTLLDSEFLKLNTIFYPFSIEYFSVSAKNILSASLSNFSVLVNGTLYNTTTGTVITSLVHNGSILYNVTVASDDYFNVTSSNLNISSDLAVTGMYQAIIDVYANETITNSNLSNFSVYDIRSATSVDSNNSFSRLNVMSGDNQNFTFNKSGYYNKTSSFNITALETYNDYNILGVYDYLLNFTAKENLTSSVINNFTLNLSQSSNSYSISSSTSSAGLSFPILSSLNYTSIIDATNHALSSANHTVLTGNSSVYNYSLWLTNSVYISLYDEETEALLSGTNVSLEIFSATDSQTGTTTNGTILFSDLTVDDYHIRYSATGYAERSYFVSVGSRTTTSVNLYLLNTSQAVNVTTYVFDTTGDPVENALVKMLKFYIDCNCYQTVQVEETDFEGSAANFLVDGFNSELYKFIISFGGADYLETNPFKITSATLNFFIVSSDLDVTSSLGVVNGIASNLSFSNVTADFTFTYSDSGSNVVSACLKVYRELPSSSTLTNSTCISSTAGTITVTAPRINGTTYKAVANVVFDGENYVIDTLYQTYSSGGRITGLVGVFLTMILVLGFALISLWNPSVSIVLTVTAIVLAGVLGILTIGKTALMGLIAVGVIIILRNKS